MFLVNSKIQFSLPVMDAYYLQALSVFMKFNFLIKQLLHLKSNFNYNNIFSAFKWFLCRYVELLCKSLLIGYYIKFSLFETIPLLIIGLGYLSYSILCTFIFTLFDY